MCFLPEAANGVICLLVITLRQTRYQLYLEQLTPKAERHVNPELSWGIHSFYGQPVPAPHHCRSEEFLPYIESRPTFFFLSGSAVTGGNGFKLKKKKGRYILYIRKKFFATTVVRCWHRLPVEAVDAP